jgi:NDP-sugar pyrophosphorylase family protein
MRAVLFTGRPLSWTRALNVPWPLLPFGNRPLLEYWFELCLDLEIRDVTLVLGEGSARIEEFVGNGEQWGVSVSYSFLREDRSPASFLLRSPNRWKDGLLLLAGPRFPLRGREGKPAPAANSVYLSGPAEAPDVLLCGPSGAQALLDAQYDALRSSARPFSECGIEPSALSAPREFFDLNMRLIGGERSRYVTSGYYAADGSSVGYNVVVSPSARLAAPIVLGNDCRIGALATVGPGAVVGHRTIVDRQSELTRCVVLSGTYVGMGLELREKIVAGDTIMDPEDGTAVQLNDPWLLAPLGVRIRVSDVGRALVGWFTAVLLALAQMAAFVILAPVLRLTGAGRLQRVKVYGPRWRIRRAFMWQPAGDAASKSLLACVFRGLSLDLFPLIAAAACGRLWLWGHEVLRAPQDLEVRTGLSAYFPAAFHYSTAVSGCRDTQARKMEAAYYAHYRSLKVDLGLFVRALVGRLATMFSNR